MATFYNQATLSYNGNTTTSNITTGELNLSKCYLPPKLLYKQSTSRMTH